MTEIGNHFAYCQPFFFSCSFDASMKDQLPEYMQVCYQTLLDLYSEFEAEMMKEGRSESAVYVKEAVGLYCKTFALRMLILLVNLCSCQLRHCKLM